MNSYNGCSPQYVRIDVALKDNQRAIKRQAESLLERSVSKDFYEKTEKGHGRIERRYCESVKIDEEDCIRKAPATNYLRLDKVARVPTLVGTFSAFPGQAAIFDYNFVSI